MIGVDIIKVDRILPLALKDINNKIFTPNEVNYAMTKSEKINSDGVSQRANTFAGIYASKEAFLKAFGIGIGNILALNEIEILHDELGKPFIFVTAKIEKLLKSNNLNRINLSISHDAGIAISVVEIL